MLLVLVLVLCGVAILPPWVTWVVCPMVLVFAWVVLLVECWLECWVVQQQQQQYVWETETLDWVWVVMVVVQQQLVLVP